jgi:hypothetical protein
MLNLIICYIVKYIIIIQISQNLRINKFLISETEKYLTKKY